MTDTHLLEDPTNRIVAVFDDRDRWERARQDLVQAGLPDLRIRVMQGHKDASRVDTSAKWFADTDEEIARYQRELEAGNVVIAVPAQDPAVREQLHGILKRHNARWITHFGQWITEAMK
jgi:hypothetical protein